MRQDRGNTEWKKYHYADVFKIARKNNMKIRRGELVVGKRKKKWKNMN